MTFLLFWNERNPKYLSTISIQLTTDTENEPELNILKAILKAFTFVDVGDLSLENVPLTKLENVYAEMVLPSDKEEEQTYNLKNFLRTRLKPAFRLLFDVVHKVFLSQIGTNEQVTVNKYKLMVAVYKNLDINWTHILLSSINEEAKKVVSKLDDMGL